LKFNGQEAYIFEELMDTFSLYYGKGFVDINIVPMMFPNI